MVLEIKIYRIKLRTNNFLENPRKRINVYVTLTIRNAGCADIRIYRMSQNLCHKLFLGIPHPQLSKQFQINMGLKVNRFRDIHCCLEIREML